MGELNDQRVAGLQVELSNAYYQRDVARRERDAALAELEACRKDAERWRFVRSPIGTRSPYAIWNEGRMPVFSKIADACIDDAIRKEALDV